MSHILDSKRGRVIADDKRWMIRGVDRKVRRAVKDAAKAEGVGVGVWVRRALMRALDSGQDNQTNAATLGEHMRILGARLSVLEKSHRDLHQKIYVDKLTAKSASEKRNKWRPTSRSK
jgi:hypothetical protein